MKTSASHFTMILLIALVIIPSAAFSQVVTGSGSLSYTYPLDLPAGRNNMGPLLSLAYNSNAGNGILGMGWSIGGLSTITRDASYTITFDDTNADHFLLDGQKLVKYAASYNNSEYHTEKEDYSWIDFYGENTSTSYWVVTLKNGTKMYYGYDDDDHSAASDGHVNAIDQSGKALVWCLSRVEDVLGNYYCIEYAEDTTNGDYYPIKITWTKPYVTSSTYLHTVEFAYSLKPSTDIGTMYIPTVFKMDKRLEYITVKTGGNVARMYKINYTTSTYTQISLLAGITGYGSDVAGAPAAGTYSSIAAPSAGSALPGITFTYSGTGCVYVSRAVSTTGMPTSGSIRFADVNGDGKDDLVNIGTSKTKTYLGNSDGTFADSVASSFTGSLLGDVNGDGRTDLIKFDGTANTVRTYPGRTDGTFSGTYAQTSLGSNYHGGDSISDITGDGLADLIVFASPSSPIFYVYPGEDDGTFGTMTITAADYPSDQHITVTFRGSRLADITGEGTAEIIQNYQVTDNQTYAVIDIYNICKSNTKGLLYGIGSLTYNYLLTPIGFADVNGDSKSDFIYYSGESDIFVRESKGDGTFGSEISNTSSLSSYNYLIGDVNGDNKNDLVAWKPSYRWVNIFRARQNGTFASVATDDSTVIAADNVCYLADITGDGKADLIAKRTSESTIYVFRGDNGNATAADILTEINLPAGGKIAAAYAPAPQVPDAIVPSESDYPAIAAKSTQNLVTGIAASDGFGNTITTGYAYYNHLTYTGYPKYRDGLGFEYIKKTDMNTGSAAYGTYTKTYYYQEKPYNGFVLKTELYDEEDYKYQATEHKYNKRAITTGINFIYKAADYSYNYNGDNEESTAIEYRVRYCDDPDTPDDAWYDSRGNLLQMANDGDLSTTDDDTSVTSAYAYNNLKNISVPIHITKTAKNLAGTTTTASDFTLYYDGNEDSTVINGLLTKKVIGNGEEDITLKYGYDVYGNLVWVKDPRTNAGEFTGDTTRYVYDENYKTCLANETNALGHTTAIDYDTLMRPYHVTDANSRQWETAYDVFSRAVKAASPGDDIDTSPSQQIIYDDTPEIVSGLIVQPVSIRSIVKQDESNIISSYSYIDGLGRLIQSKYPSETTSMDDKWITVDQYFDYSGRGCKTSVPYLSSTIDPIEYTTPNTYAAYSENTYDAIGRIIQSTNTDGTYSRTVYEKKRVVFIDGNNHISSREIDGNEIIESTYDTDYSGTVPESSTAYYRTTTKAAWNGAQIQDSMSGSAQTTISIVTDMLGRKLNYTDTDMGTWTYNYDANGNLTSQTDAKSQTINFDYDRLNRVRHKYYGASLNSTCLYDGKNEAGEPDGVDHGYCTGMLTKVEYPEGSETYKYDERGRVTEIRKTISGAGERTITLAYDSLNRLTQETRPDGEIVSYAYGTDGNLISVTGNRGGVITHYATDLEYTAYGKLKSILYGNGITTTYSYYDDAAGDPSNGNRAHSYRLKEIIAERQDGLEIAHTTYEYDAVDNLKKKYFIDDFEGEYSEEYTYDVFNRLTFAHSVGLYGDKEYAYQPNNNISLKDGRAYEYTSVRPHAVTNDERYLYSYDANGNMTGRDDGMTIVHDYENRVSNISGGNIYSYDDTGSRIKKTEGAATTYYFFGNYEEMVEAGATTIVTYYFANGQRIAQRTTTATESDVVYYHTDHLGSALRLTDDTGDIVQSIAYDPFGKTVFASGIENTKYQYTDQEFDEGTGFYYYGARYYDPEMGRFLQADTILDGLNRYAYCNNNPVIFTDPSGHNPHYTTGDYIVSDSYEKVGQTYIDVTYISPDHLITHQFEGNTVTYDSNGIITGSTYSGNTQPLQGSGQNGNGGGTNNGQYPQGKNIPSPVQLGTDVVPYTTSVNTGNDFADYLFVGLGTVTNTFSLCVNIAGMPFVTAGTLYGMGIDALDEAFPGAKQLVEDLTMIVGMNPAETAIVISSFGHFLRSIGAGAGAVGAAGVGKSATTPVGRRGSPIFTETNSAATINGRQFTGHALNRMQQQGIVPSLIDDAIQNGTQMKGKMPGTTAYYSPSNNLTIITDTATGNVITVDFGFIKQ